MDRDEKCKDRTEVAAWFLRWLYCAQQAAMHRIGSFESDYVIACLHSPRQFVLLETSRILNKNYDNCALPSNSKKKKENEGDFPADNNQSIFFGRARGGRVVCCASTIAGLFRVIAFLLVFENDRSKRSGGL